MAFSIECTLMRAEQPLVGFLLANCGFIEFIFDATWTFDLIALDTVRTKLEERAGDSPLGTRRYEFGEAIIATRTTGTRMIFAEVIREL